ncbi:MAG TPA: hypothetical protein ENJ60_04940, partial [Aeromonadales bacterium]|nr:hypothetical protein [Aeromonadales bacterium]
MRWLVIEPQLPWDTSNKAEKRFQLIVIILLVLSIVFTLVISRIVLPPKARKQAEIPERMVKMVL